MKVTGVTFTIDRERLKRSMVSAVNFGVTAAAAVYVDGIKKSMMRYPKGTPSQPGQPPNWQEGTLVRNIAKTPTKNGVSIVHTSNNRYARGLEYGITIRAKPGKALPVPVSKTARKILRDVGDAGLKTSAVRMTMIRRRGKPPLLVRTMIRKGKNSTKLLGSEILFVLKKSVTIKARPFMGPAERSPELYAAALAQFEAAATSEIRKAVQ